MTVPAGTEPGYYGKFAHSPAAGAHRLLPTDRYPYSRVLNSKNAMTPCLHA